VGVNIADGFSRVSTGRRIGVCVMQSNQGIENALSGVAQAFDDSAPILVLPMGPARNRINVLRSFSAVQNCRGITKWVDSISAADQVPAVMRRVYTYLKMGRPGPR